MTTPLRAAVLFEYPSLNGGEFSWLAALPAMRAANIEIVAIAPPTGPLADRLAMENIRIEPWIASDANSGQRFSQKERRTRLTGILSNISPAVVHANSLSMSRMLGPVASSLEIPSLGHIRDIVRLSRKAVEDLNQVDRLLAVSHATGDWHIENGMDPARVQVQYNGVDLDRFCPFGRSDDSGPNGTAPAEEGRGALHRRLGLDPSWRLVGNMGQLGLRKGTEKVLESATLLAQEFADVHWVIAGERHSQKQETVEFEARLHHLAASPTLAGRVHFVGRVSDTAAWMRDLSLLVHAARQEPLGRVLLEGCACALPIVATDVGGTREILDGVGSLVPVDDVAALTAAIRERLLDPEGCTVAGKRARERAADRFDQTFRGSQLAGHYRSVAVA